MPVCEPSWRQSSFLRRGVISTMTIESRHRRIVLPSVTPVIRRRSVMRTDASASCGTIAGRTAIQIISSTRDMIDFTRKIRMKLTERVLGTAWLRMHRLPIAAV